ncbi:tigger transposable element-derived protein 6-like protein [Plakobranchus ocellatus]|uniref:Tigger transposable element-derived protein 6-like protein n=1 Tax=Plakobranchus ocellatus TaxID=259542 RepID=A0AAV4DZI3_9GAST|nr:tigger transposable element-derived protein 6-like protein [Plakobranchus ocellatus]
MLHNAPPGANGLANQSGWMTGDLFLESLQHFVRHSCSSKEHPTLLLLDNHESHVTLAAVDFCRDKGVHLLSFPSHGSHKLQPLDRTIYGPMKKFYYTACNEWMYQNPGQRMTIYDVAGLVGKAYPKAFTSTNILSGFRNTGISPLDVNVFGEDDFVQSFVTDQAVPPVQDVPSRDSGAPLVQPEDPGTSSAATPIPPEKSRSASGVEKDEDLPTVEQQTNHEASRFENTTAQLEQREINLEKAAFSSCSPEVLRPHPKTERRTYKTRRLGKTRILNDTPKKNEIAAKKTRKRKTSGKQAKQESCTKRFFKQQAEGTKTANLPGRSILKASYHQGQGVFSPETRGRQCTAIAAAAVAYSSVKNVREWCKTDLDLILITGDSFYRQIDQQRPDTEDGFHMITDILDQAQLFNAKFALDRTKPLHGLVSHHQSHELVFTLADGVNKVFQQKCTAILIMKDMSVMIHACKEDGTCFVFDSHARGNNGLPAATGKSVLIKFRDSSDLVEYLYEFASNVDSEVSSRMKLWE